MVIIHFVIFGKAGSLYLLGVVLILEEYVEILILFIWDSANPGINVVAEVGGSLNYSSLAQDQWICSIVNKGWFSQISHLSLMDLNSDGTRFSTVISFCLFLRFLQRGHASG